MEGADSAAPRLQAEAHDVGVVRGAAHEDLMAVEDVTALHDLLGPPHVQDAVVAL